MAQTTSPSAVPDTPDRQGDRPAGSVTLICDPNRYEFYIDAQHGHSTVALKTTLKFARRQGFHAFDPAGIDLPTVLDDGTVRIWLEPDASYDDLNPLR